MARVLVGYGTKMGGTAGIAAKIGEVLAGAGHEATVVDAKRARFDGGYDAVVVGSGLYNGGWRGEAIGLLRRVARSRERMPVWLYHSGPLGDDEAGDEKPLPASVLKQIGDLDVRGSVTFGGRLPENAGGFIARAMVRNGRGGDWRDLEGRVASWAGAIAGSL